MVWEILLILFIGLIISSKENIKVQRLLFILIILIIVVNLWCSRRKNIQELFDTSSNSQQFSNGSVNTKGLYCSNDSQCGPDYKCVGIKNNVRIFKTGKCANSAGVECAYDDQCGPPYKCDGVIKKQVNSGYSQFVVNKQGICTDANGKTYNVCGLDTDCVKNSQTCVGSSLKQANITSYGFCVYNGSGSDPGESPIVSTLFPGLKGSSCNIDFDCGIPGYFTPYTCVNNKCTNTK
jgi:hypothetical protein